ncbi:MAG: SemiSWEET transporter [Chromatiaceae bacterium]|nr:SemiSWEET transporter [Chromatiaceae bacterium]
MPLPPQEIIGFMAAVLTTASFVPQVVRTIRTRDTHAISVWMYLLFCTGVALWGIYGVLLGSWPIILANGVTFALSAAVLFLKVRGLVSNRSESADGSADSD